MANQRNNPPKRGALKPLPQPIRMESPEKKTKRSRSPAPIRMPETGPPTTRAQQKPSSSTKPSLPQAFAIFLQRNFIGKREKGTNRKSNAPRPPVVGLIMLGLVCVALIVLLIWSVTNKNAYAVLLGETTVVGHIAMAKDIDAISLQNLAVSRLEASLGAKVKVNETVTIEPIHSSRKNILPYDDVINEIVLKFTYKLAATAIYVNGVEIAVLKTESEANYVRDYLMAPYLKDGVTYISKEFVEEWTLIDKYVDQEQLDTTDDALLQLDKKETVLQAYTIQSGDNLGLIAVRNQTTIEKICADNGISRDTILRVGNTLNLETKKPVMSVITVEEIIQTDTEPMTTRNQENANEPKTYTKVLQEGKDGQRETVIRIKRLNGMQSEPEQVISSRITVQPIERIIEVGTLDNTPQRR